jgi:hypothetical protein
MHHGPRTTVVSIPFHYIFISGFYLPSTSFLHAIAEAMRGSLLTAGALIQSQGSRHGICGGQSGTGAESFASTTVLFIQCASVTLVQGRAIPVASRGGP